MRPYIANYIHFKNIGLAFFMSFLTSCSLMEDNPDEPKKTYNFNLEIQRGTAIVQGVDITTNRPSFNSGRVISGSFFEGAEIVVEVTPNDGFYLNKWKGIDTDSNIIVLNPTSDIDLEPEILPIVCPEGNCWTMLYTDSPADQNGYHHVTTQWYSNTAGRFVLYIDSSPTSSVCQYNAVPAVRSIFNSDTYWEVESGLSFTFGLYNPFESLFTQQGNIIKVKDTTVTLDYFQGQIIPIVQETTIIHDVKDKMDCYGWDNPYSGTTPKSTENCVLTSKRIVGPLLREMVGDTIKIYSKTFFDCNSVNHEIIDSINVIIE